MTMRYKPPQVPPPGAPAGPPRYKAWQGFEPEVPEFVPDPMQVAGGGVMPPIPAIIRPSMMEDIIEAAAAQWAQYTTHFPPLGVNRFAQYLQDMMRHPTLEANPMFGTSRWDQSGSPLRLPWGQVGVVHGDDWAAFGRQWLPHPSFY